MELEDEVLARLKPGVEEEAKIRETVDRLIKTVMDTEAAGKCDFEPYLVGSIAKDTHLRDPDADLFLLFDPDMPREELEKHGLAIGREAIGGREHYAEHPYIKGEFEGLKTDIVPAYKILDSSQKMTAVDRTPFHAEFVRQNLAPELKDDVRLLKAFMKGIGTYSAEARVMGFSGYLCELLVIKYGGFHNLLEQTKSWKRGQRLEIGNATHRKFDAALTFIDPVDAGRNVASAVSADSLAVFIAASRDYLTSPELEFFFPNPVRILSEHEIKEALAPRGHILAMTMPKPDIIDDILYPQLRKFQRNACQMLSNGDFRVMDSAYYVTGESMSLIVELEDSHLPGARLHHGPPAWAAENAGRFLEKWENNKDARSAPFIRDGHWQVFVRRRHASARELILDELESLDMGKDLNRLRNRIRISPEIDNSETMREAISEYLDRGMPWKRPGGC